MTLSEAIAKALNPALAFLPPRMDSPEARVELLTIGQQESRFQYRRQLGNGPARSFWQFEQGGVKGVMNHPATRDWARAICDARGVPFDVRAVWNAMEFDDVLACVFARLNLWWAPGPLPPVTSAAKAWDLYVFTWRPGKPHRQTWDAFHLASRTALGLA